MLAAQETAMCQNGERSRNAGDDGHVPGAQGPRALSSLSRVWPSYQAPASLIVNHMEKQQVCRRFGTLGPAWVCVPEPHYPSRESFQSFMCVRFARFLGLHPIFPRGQILNFFLLRQCYEGASPFVASLIALRESSTRRKRPFSPDRFQ